MSQEDFALANRAFELFSLAEREMALERFSRLQFRSIADRFFEAVHQIVHERQRAKEAGQEFGDGA